MVAENDTMDDSRSYSMDQGGSSQNCEHSLEGVVEDSRDNSEIPSRVGDHRLGHSKDDL